MSDCANEAMADPNGLNLPSNEGASCNDMLASNLDSAHTTNIMQRMSSGAAAAAAQLDPKYIIAHSGGPIGSSSQQHTAAAFFASSRKASHAKHNNILPSSSSPMHQIANGNMSSKHNSKDTNTTNNHRRNHHVCDYSTVLNKCPPPIPSCLLKKMEMTEVSGLGKVRVILRVANSGVIDDTKVGNSSFFQMDKKKRQVTLFDRTSMKNESMPSSTMNSSDSNERRIDVAAPKMFAFDGLYTDEDSQNDVSTCALTDTIHSVVNGTDGCLFCFGHANLGKTYTMIGSDESSKTLGVIPSAIAWLYRCIKEKKDKSGTRFSIRVSAIEIGGAKEDVRDLLQSHEGDSDQDLSGAPPPSAFIPHKTGAKIGNSISLNHPNILQNVTELRSPSAEKAGHFLDSALTARSTNMAADVNGRDSHFIFTLHVYQYAVDKSSSTPNRKSIGSHVVGGRSRLHLIDFGGCERTKTSGGGITLSGLGNVILAIFNGQRHLPCKESRVTALLKECLGSLSCQATMIAHVSPQPSHYSETLHTTQLASRIHRMRRKKSKSSGGSGGGSGSGSSDETKNKLVKLMPGSGTSSSDVTTGTSTDPSSSEQSCDTVIYVGSRDDEGTDAEHPPVYIPSLDSGDARGIMANVLRGSSAELPNHSNVPKSTRKSSSSTLERRRQSKSPASSLSNHKHLSTSRQRPGSVGSTPVHNSQAQGRLNSSKKSNQTASSPLALSHNSQNMHLMAQYNMGRGSLPRNPRGKMPLYGKVAGYRQPASNSNAAVVAQEYWIDQKGAPTFNVEATPQHSSQKTGFSQNPQIMLLPYPCQQNTLKTPSHQSSGGSPCQDHPFSIEQQAAIYGYMDDHKINMIQHWVECQTSQMNKNCSSPVHPTPHHQPSPLVFHPPQQLTNPSHFQQPHESQQEPIPFAWLNQPMNNDIEDENGCKILTQFKTADSSDDSFSDSAQQQQIEQQQHKGNEYFNSKKRASQANSHSGGSANHSVIAADIHSQPQQHVRTSKVNSSIVECSNNLSAKHNSQVLPDDTFLSTSASSATHFTKETPVYSSIEQQRVQKSNKDDQCGQGDNKQQPIYATINQESKRNKKKYSGLPGCSSDKLSSTSSKSIKDDDNDALISSHRHYNNESVKSTNGSCDDNPTTKKAISSTTTTPMHNVTRKSPASNRMHYSKEGKVSEGVSVDLSLEINHRENSSYCTIPTDSSLVTAFSKTICNTNDSHANKDGLTREILVKRDSNESYPVHTASKCYALSNSKAEDLLSESKNGSATVVEQQWSNMNSLDELYNHCEQLVETLSQASEDIMHMEREEYLQVFKRKSSSITKDDQEKIPDIHQTEILPEDEYEEIDGEKFTIQKDGAKSASIDTHTSNGGNQVKEEEKQKQEECEKDQQKVNMVENACLNNQNQTKPLQSEEHKQQGQPLRMLSEENLATTVSSFDGQALHYVGNKNKVLEQKKYNFIKDMKTTRNSNGGQNNGIKNARQEPIQPSMFETVDESFGNVQTDLINVDGAVDHEEYFSKKFGQLAKLHELYQSVSSISAKSQSHLDAAQQNEENNMCKYNNGGLRGSTLSLSALLNDLERTSIGGCSNADSDVNSLCSEPVKMYDYNDFVDFNKNTALSTLSVEDIFDDICGNKNSLSNIHSENEKNSLPSMYHNKSTMSLCEFGLNNMSIENGSLSGDKRNKDRLCFYSSDINVTEDRSDSPILEEIDQELAKYAKLKDLKHAYDPSNSTTPSISKPTLSSSTTTKNERIVQKSGKVEEGEVKINDDPLGITNTTSNNNSNGDGVGGGLSTFMRQPDGASNPDLNFKLPCNNNNNNGSNVSSSSNNTFVTAAIVPSVILHQNECFSPSKPSKSHYNNIQTNSCHSERIESLKVNTITSNTADALTSENKLFVQSEKTSLTRNSKPLSDSNTPVQIHDRRSPGNGQSGSDPEPEQLEMMNYNLIKQGEINELNSNHCRRNEGLQASTSSSSSLSTTATSASTYSRESKNNNNNDSLNSGFAVIHRYGRGMQLNSRNERTILGKSQSTTDCDTSSEHEVWVENKVPTSAKPVLPPSVKNKVVLLSVGNSYDTTTDTQEHDNKVIMDKTLNENSKKCSNGNIKSEIMSMQKSKVPKFSRLFKLSRSPLKIVKIQTKSSEATKKPSDITNQKMRCTNGKNSSFFGNKTVPSPQNHLSNGKEEEKKTLLSCNDNFNNGTKEPHHYHHHGRNTIKSSPIDAKISSGKRIGGGDSNNKNGMKGFKDIHQSSPTLLSSASSSPVRSNNRHSQESKNAKGTSSSESLRVNGSKNCKDSDSYFRPSCNNNLSNCTSTSKQENNQHKRFFAIGKKTTSKVTKTNQQKTFVETQPVLKAIPSPYSFITKPRFTKRGLKQDTEQSSGSEYDSGHDSGNISTEAALVSLNTPTSSKTKTSSFIKTCKFVKLRSNKGGRGGANSFTKASLSSLHSSNAATPNSPSQKKNIRASHCKSSGYESSAGERDSIDSTKGGLEVQDGNVSPANTPTSESIKSKFKSENTLLVKSPTQKNNSPILSYDHDFIERLDKRWRFDEVRRLRQSQNCLKDELTKAKERIGADPKRWSFELHVEENLDNLEPRIQETDPTFIEALSKETSILEKRVDACKSHAILQTCFDYHPPTKLTLLDDSTLKNKKKGSSSSSILSLNDKTEGISSSSMENRDNCLSPMTQKLFDNCCTTECDPAQDMILPSTNETEIF